MFVMTEFDNYREPVSVDPDQWPEGRGFRRVYVRDPDRQARLVKALLGFRQDLREYHGDTTTVEAIDVVLRTFHQHFPEFMQVGYQREPDTEWSGGEYNADDRLLRKMQEILDPEPVVGEEPLGLSDLSGATHQVVEGLDLDAVDRTYRRIEPY